MSLLKSVAAFSSITLISRVAGFARDWLMALTIGAGPASDAFFVAFKLPNFFRRLFAEGAFSAAFVPYFAAINAQGAELGPEGQELGQRFAERVLSIFLPTLLMFVALVEAVMPGVVWALTGGFADKDPDKLALAIKLTRITFPFLALISLVSLLAGVLNGLGRFAAAAAMPVVLNIVLISAMLLSPKDPQSVVVYLAAGVTIAGLLQVLLLLWALKQAGMSLRLRWPSISPNVKAMLVMMVPAALGAGAVQINLLIDVLLATRFLPEGSISYLYFGDRLSQLPIGVIGVAVGTVLLPRLSAQLSSGARAKALDSQNRAIELVLVLTLPAMAALLAIPKPLITVLFEHGAFDAADSAATAAALMAYGAGLPAYVLIKVLTPGFYARGDTKTPVRITLVSLALNTVLGVALMQVLAHVGLALATALAAWVNAIGLFVILQKRGHLALDARLKQAWPRMCLAAALMGAALYAATHPFGDVWSRAPYIALPAILAVVFAGMALYAALGQMTGAFSLADIKARMRRSKPA